MTESTRRQKSHEVSAATASRPRRRRPAVDMHRRSLGEWLYEHRLGLCAVLLLYSSLISAMWVARVEVERKPVAFGVVFEAADEQLLDEAERLRRRRDELIREIEQRQFDWSQVKNVASNEAADKSAASAPQYDATTQELMDKVASEAAANRSEYERGMKSVGAIGQGGGSGSGAGGQGKDKESGKFSGRVTISYVFRSPVRHHRSLYQPAYRCEGGGEVVVSVWVDRGGKVKTAHIKSWSGGDQSMKEIARQAALRSVFDINPSAPATQEGEITYTFIPQ